MAYTNVTDVNLSRGIHELFYYINDVTGSWVSIMMLVAIYVITCFGVYQATKDMTQGFAIAGFLLFIVSFLFWIAGFLSGVTFSIVVVVSIISFASLWL